MHMFNSTMCIHKLNISIYATQGLATNQMQGGIRVEDDPRTCGMYTAKQGGQVRAELFALMMEYSIIVCDICDDG